jgi:serine protease Do
MRRTAAVLVLALAACSRRAEPPPAPTPAPASPVDAAPLPAGGLVEVPEIHVPSLAPLVERVTRTVVSLDVEAAPEMPPGHERYLQSLPDDLPPEQRAGSGFLVSRNGEVVTNNHVVEGARRIAVVLQDGRRFDAELIGRDGPTDLALVRMKKPPADLPVATLGDSDHLKVGDWLLAVGNPFGLATSVSLGILSATARDLGAGPYDEFLQTDAAINPGNSGGPLFDLEGKVVGVNTAIAGPTTSIGFAVPASLVRALLPELERVGGITRGALGAYLQELTPALANAMGIPGKTGAVVSGFVAGSGAQEAGIERDDVVVSLDGHPIDSTRQLIREVGFRKPGELVRLGLLRAGEPRTVSVKLGTRGDLEGTGPLTPRQSAAKPPQRLGVEISDLTPEAERQLGVRGPGALVVAVEPGSPAARAGVQAGQVIVEVAGHAVRSAEETSAALREARAQPPVVLRLRGPGKTSAVATVRP